MTYTEAAVEVLRQVGRPLHYKKIAQIAVELGLLSHVGKSPEITMSTRLATMLRKDRGDSPIVKVKPGVFGLREFPEEVLKAAAEGDNSMEVDLSELTAPASEPPEEEPAAETTEGGAGEQQDAPTPSLPGVDSFPEEEDDDEPILGRPSEPPPADAEGEEGAEAGSGRRKKRRRRRRKGRDKEEATATQVEQAAPSEASPVRAVRMRRPVAESLADAVEDVLQGGSRQWRSFVDVARALVQRGRLEGDPRALAATVAATVRGDEARRRADARRLRFRVSPEGVRLLAWDVPGDAVRAEREARRFAARQRRRVREELLRRLESLPAEGFVEIVASWLCAEGVSSIRGVLPPVGLDGYHLAGQLRHAGLEARLAVVAFRGTTVGQREVVALRGSLHHYGPASMGWIVTTGTVAPEAREEAAMAGAAPIALLDGAALGEALERAGIGIRAVHVPLATLDADLLDALSGDRRESTRRGEREASRREAQAARAGRTDKSEKAPDEATSERAAASDEQAGDEAEPAAATGRKRRRRRRKSSSSDEGAAPEVVEAASVEEPSSSEPPGPDVPEAADGADGQARDESAEEETAAEVSEVPEEAVSEQAASGTDAVDASEPASVVGELDGEVDTEAAPSGADDTAGAEVGAASDED